MTDTTYLYIACVVGILARTVVPYLMELKDKPETKFDKKFLTPPVAAIAISLLTAPIVLGTLPSGQDWIAAFIFGWGTQDITRELSKLAPME